MLESLRQLGFSIREEGATGHTLVSQRQDSMPGVIPATSAKLFVANSGTTMRFLTAMISLGHGDYSLDGIPRMRERPIRDLAEAIQSLGVTIHWDQKEGYPPLTLKTASWKKNHVAIRGNTSSQFLSGLLMAACRAPFQMVIQLDSALVSEPYVQMTISMLRHWGYTIEQTGSSYTVIPHSERIISEYFIEPDASGASYFLAAAAISSGKITIPGLWQNSTQGDIAFVKVLAQMGCQISEDHIGTHLQGAQLKGIDIDMNAISDTVMTLAAVACFAVGPTTIRNVAHIRHKETDRLTALSTELRKTGCKVEEWEDGIRITPQPLHGATIDTYNDHRMAMSLSLLGLKVPGIIINNPSCTSKTYPTFWQDFEKLYT